MPPHVVVVGAGAFGGWTALALRRRGARVTIVDAWGPGNARASSGGETRVIRSTYGSHAVYTRMASRALERWEAHDAEHQTHLLSKTGVLWMFGADTQFGRASVQTMRAEGLRIDELSIAEAARRFPQIAFDAVLYVLWEADAGYLLARRACEHVLECGLADGADYLQAAVPAPVREDGPLRRLTLTDGSTIEADAFVFACGPWLGSVFPHAIGARVTPTRQESYYFGTPGKGRFEDPAMPVWIDFGDRFVYGIPGNAGRGFKIADDTPGPPFDPTDGSREATAEGIAAARAFLATRFPALAHAPLLGSDVCQYEATPDSHFILDRHPSAPDVWIAGGGSGHGFKMGPIVGEIIASAVLDGAPPDRRFALARFDAPPIDGWAQKWA
jgi:glycine/D-amino acid oxidase-like deaminating enzyme